MSILIRTWSRLFKTTLLILATAATARAQSVWYVDGGASSNGNGTSWSSPFTHVDSALSVALSGDQVWVKQLSTGSYYPRTLTNPSDPRSATFLIPDGIRLIGGFLGTETALPPLGSVNGTILSGDVGQLGVAGDNSYHVLTQGDPTVPHPVLTSVERFTIRDGQADLSPNLRGGGVFARGFYLRFTDCVFKQNAAQQGGAIFAELGHLSFKRCSFTGNTSTGIAGAIYARTLNMDVINGRFEGNSSVGNGGAVLLASIGASPSGYPNAHFQNCLFADNASGARGGAVYLGGSKFSSGRGAFVNCTFSQNSATTDGGSVAAQTGTQVPAVSLLRNCVSWGNSAASSPELWGAQDVEYSDVAGGVLSGAGNISNDPLLSASLMLTAGSPCLDAGHNASVLPDFVDLDRDGNTSEPTPLDLRVSPLARFLDDPTVADTGCCIAPIVDMGAFESASTTP